LLVSTLVDSQALAFLIGLLLSLLPTFVLSGFIFPIASMPLPIQYITVIVPARYFLVALRGIVLKGVGFGALAASVRGPRRVRVRRAGPGVHPPGEGAWLMRRLGFLVRKEFQNCAGIRACSR